MAVQSFRTRMRNRQIVPMLVALLVVALALITGFAAIALAGTKTGLVLGALAALGPVAGFASLVAPLIFPFCGFIALVPFDNLLAVSSFGTATRAVAVLSGLAFILYLARTRSYILPGRALVAWSIFFAWAITSMLWSIDAPAALQALGTLLQLFVLFVAISFMRIDAKTLRTILITLLSSSAVAALYGAYLFHNSSNAAQSLTGRLFIQTDNSSIDPNHFAAALLMPLAISLAAAVYAQRWTMKVMFFASVAITAMGIAISASRGAFLALAVMFVFLLIRSRRRVALAVAGALGIGAMLALHGNVFTRFQTAFSSGGAGRADIWKVGIAAFRDHWLAGAGIGNFAFAFDQAFMHVSQSYYTHWHRASHNILVQLGVEVGIIGIAAFFYAYWTQFRSLKVVTRDHALYPLRLGLEATGLGLLVAGMFLNTLTEKYFWLAMIIVVLTRNAVLIDRRKPAR